MPTRSTKTIGTLSVEIRLSEIIEVQLLPVQDWTIMFTQFAIEVVVLQGDSAAVKIRNGYRIVDR